MDSQLVNILNEIKEKAKVMKQRAERLEKENNALRNDVFEHLKTIDIQKEKIKTLKQDLVAKEIAHSMPHAKESLRKEIDTYMAMIDECLAGLKTK